MPTDAFSESLLKAQTYGLAEFLDIVSELSQESIRKGALDRKDKELITLGMALAKDCSRCIKIHTQSAQKLGADQHDITMIQKIVLFMNASPDDDQVMWHSWQDSWREFSLIKGTVRHDMRELVALGIALVRQQKNHIYLHGKNALELGASKQQVFEVMPIALLMDGAPAISQIPYLVEVLEKY